MDREDLPSSSSREPLGEPFPPPRPGPPVLVVFARARRPYVTLSVLALIALVFLLELLWGAPDSVPVLGRMGAMLRSRLLAGEWWRCMSSGVLHASLLHIAANSYVLWRLGAFTERLLGSARFLILYVVSGIAAALGSALLMNSMSVGASGAIWGILGAQAAIAFGAGGYLPAAARPAMRKSAGANLVLNAAVSFLPHVDWAAHFSGGAAGAALLGSGLLLRGLPGISEPEVPSPVSRRLQVLAGLLGGLYLLGAVIGVTSGRAWDLARPLEHATVELPELGARVRLPALLGPGRSEHDGDWTIYTFGDEASPVLVAIARSPRGPALPPGADPERELAAVRKHLSESGEGLETELEPHTEPRDGRLVTEARYGAPAGRTYDAMMWLGPEFLWKVEVLTWPDYPESCAEVARRVVASLEENVH